VEHDAQLPGGKPLMEEWFVDTPAQLSELCDRLEDCDAVAIDTEFLREKTYYAQLCLIQIASKDLIACVDPLAIENLKPFLDLLYEPQRTKVLHSARQDLEIFFDWRGELPRPIFDTQIAATLLGYGDQLGYAKLVQGMLGQTINKEHARTDWTRRPLEEAQLQYAMDDVRFLLPIYEEQLQRLKARGRERWLEDDFERLTDTRLYLPDPAELWRRVKGARNLKPKQLVVLQQLARWREDRARDSNRPRKWLLSDDVMVDIARRSPSSLEALEKIRGWNSFTKKHAQDILEQSRLARSIPEQQWPVAERITSLSAQQEAMVDLLMSLVRVRAMENDVTPAVLATRKDLEHLVLDRNNGAVLTGWRYELVGKELIECLNGEKIITIQDNNVVIR
jgi:ribonuclease D